MRWGWLALSYSALAAMLAVSVLNAGGTVDGDTSRWVLLAATAVWFSTAPPWMLRPRRGRSS
jgi:hypothetical protein